MNNLKTYNEYLNEGFHNWVNKDDQFSGDNVIKEIAAALSVPVYFLSAIFYGAYKASNDYNAYYAYIFLFVAASVLSLPYFIVKSKEFIRIPYNYIRSKSLLNKVSSKVEKIEKDIEKNPYIYNKLNDIKSDLKKHLEEKNYTEISNCIYRLNLTLKEYKNFKNKHSEIN